MVEASKQTRRSEARRNGGIDLTLMPLALDVYLVLAVRHLQEI